MWVRNKKLGDKKRYELLSYVSQVFDKVPESVDSTAHYINCRKWGNSGIKFKEYYTREQNTPQAICLCVLILCDWYIKLSENLLKLWNHKWHFIQAGSVIDTGRAVTFKKHAIFFIFYAEKKIPSWHKSSEDSIDMWK